MCLRGLERAIWRSRLRRRPKGVVYESVEAFHAADRKFLVVVR